MILSNWKRICLISLSLFFVATTADDATDEILVIPDAGRSMRLGEFFDARINTVVPGSLWNMNDESFSDYVYTAPASFTSVDFTAEDSFQARIELLNIDVRAAFEYTKAPSLKINIDGSFGYLSEKRSSAKSVKYTASYRTRTQRETLDVFNDHMLITKNQKIFEDDFKIATHFVSSITWGADAFVSFETAYENAAEKEEIDIWLQGSIKVASAGINAGINGTVNINDNYEKFSQKTKLSIYGDLRMNNEIPNEPRAAMKFIKELPTNTATLLEKNGIGVPMEITLTPLVWVDSTAAKLKRKIGNDLLQELIEIYGDLEKSSSHIMDVHSMRYDGYTSWKQSMDTFYKNFNQYAVKLSQRIHTASTIYISGNGNITSIGNIQSDYWSPNNPFNLVSVINKCEEKQDDITSLLALSSEFKSAGIVFAEHLSDFYAPTFDSRFDIVYGLVVVGMNPNNDRDSIALVREFIDLASSRKRDDSDQIIDPKVTHCQKKILESKKNSDSSQADVECTSLETFVVIHFDSFCDEMCEHRFCSSGPELCPTINKSSQSFCDYSDDDATKHGCFSNRHTGACFIDSNEGNVVSWNHTFAMLNPDHTIDNNLKPFSDCWCSCPKTQIIQFVENNNPERLQENMPRVPSKPNINVTDYEEDEMEKRGDNQIIRVDVEKKMNSNVRNWKVVLDYSEVVQSEEGDITFQNKVKNIYTPSSASKITVRNLRAGQTYTITVAGINSVGEGRSSEGKTFTLGHRLVNTNFTVNTSVNENDITNTLDFKDDEFPSWVESIDVSLILSTRSFSDIAKVSLHRDELSNNIVDISLYNEDSLYKECTLKSNIRSERSSSVTCLIKDMIALETDEVMEIRVWDDTDLLVAKGSVTVLSPNSNNCLKLESRFCSLRKTPICVSNCSSDCSAKSLAFRNNCTFMKCEDGMLYCPRNDKCVNENFCSSNCHDTSIQQESQCFIPGCKINLDVDLNLDVQLSSFIKNGESVSIKWNCRFRYNNLNKLIDGITFNCPNKEDLVEQDIWIYNLNDIVIDDKHKPNCQPSKCLKKCSDITTIKVDNGNIKKMVSDYSEEKDLINCFDTTLVTTMDDLFQSGSGYNGDLSCWDLSSVTSMRNMFDLASSFNGDVSSWDVASVTDMENMFSSASSFNGDVSSWDVASVTSFYGMFGSALLFNGDVSSWDVASVTDMRYTFYSASLFNGDVSNWDVASVTSFYAMFYSTSSFNSDVSNWDVASVTDMENMFQIASSFNSDISSWDVASVTNMDNMFTSASSFNSDVSSWDVASVTNMHGMFILASLFNSDVSSWDVASVTTMQAMFFSAKLFNSDVSNWDVASVMNMGTMFYSALLFNGDVSSWDVASVTSFYTMFYEASSFYRNLCKWNVEKADTPNMLTSSKCSVSICLCK